MVISSTSDGVLIHLNYVTVLLTPCNIAAIGDHWTDIIDTSLNVVG